MSEKVWKHELIKFLEFMRTKTDYKDQIEMINYIIERVKLGNFAL